MGWSLGYLGLGQQVSHCWPPYPSLAISSGLKEREEIPNLHCWSYITVQGSLPIPLWCLAFWASCTKFRPNTQILVLWSCNHIYSMVLMSWFALLTEPWDCGGEPDHKLFWPLAESPLTSLQFLQWTLIHCQIVAPLVLLGYKKFPLDDRKHEWSST
jgi:hypothetical protein